MKLRIVILGAKRKEFDFTANDPEVEWRPSAIWDDMAKKKELTLGLSLHHWIARKPGGGGSYKGKHNDQAEPILREGDVVIFHARPEMEPRTEKTTPATKEERERDPRVPPADEEAAPAE